MRKTVTFEDIERNLVNQHKDVYYSWIRSSLLTNTTVMTGLLAFQNNYIPDNATLSQLLISSWLLLVLSIGCGLYALRAEYDTPLNAARSIRRLRAAQGDEQAAVALNQNLMTHPGKFHHIAVNAMLILTLASLMSVVAFASINLMR